MADFMHPVLIQRIGLLGIRPDTFRFFAMHEQQVFDRYVDGFEAYFPVSLTFPGQYSDRSGLMEVPRL